MKAISFERLSDLAIWLSVQANVSTSDVKIRVVDDELRLKVVTENTDYGLKVVGDRITYHTMTDVTDKF